MLLRYSFIVINVIAFILVVQSLSAHIPQLHIYMAQFPLLPLLGSPLPPPLCPLPLTWHPPVVTGIVYLPLRLLVNWPHLLPFTQLTLPSHSQRPTYPAPNNDDLGNILALGVQNTACQFHALLPCPCCLSMSMLHLHVHAACLCHAVCPCAHPCVHAEIMCRVRSLNPPPRGRHWIFDI